MEKDSAIERTVNLVIQALQQLGFFDHPFRVAEWHLRRDGRILISKGYRAAATVIGETPTIVLPEDFSLEEDIDALIHESIHLAQIIKGDLIPGYGNGTSVWKGRQFKNLSSTHERYSEDQPWEDEARNIYPSVIRKMSELSSRTQ